MNDVYCKTPDTLVYETDGDIGIRIEIDGEVGIGIEVDGALMRWSAFFGRTRAIVDSDCTSEFDKK